MIITIIIIHSGWSGHKWAMPSLSHLQQLIRHVYENPEEAKGKGIQGRIDMVNHYSLPVMGQKVIQEMERIKEIITKRKEEL